MHLDGSNLAHFVMVGSDFELGAFQSNASVIIWPKPRREIFCVLCLRGSLHHSEMSKNSQSVYAVLMAFAV